MTSQSSALNAIRKAQVIVEHGRPKTVLCPNCRTEEEYNKVVESIGAQMSDQIGRVLEKSTRGNKSVRFERGIRPRRPRARFKLDL